MKISPVSSIPEKAAQEENTEGKLSFEEQRPRAKPNKTIYVPNPNPVRQFTI
jgi:hypothetical protein